LEGILETTPDELSSVLWYLKQRGLVRSDDKSSLHITVDGMDFLENKKPSPDEIMPFIKTDAIAGGKTPAPVPKAPAAAHATPATAETESVRSVLNRVLARV
jgi:hypothetical protein